jgi:nicotinamide riboside transporter PnuC
VKPIVDITDQLPKNPAGDWLHMAIQRKNGRLEVGPRSFTDITHISLHHTAVEGGTPEGHARYHISKGYGGIAYHIYIRGDQIYQVNDLLAFTWHTQSNNYQTIGIVVEGDFTKRQLTEKERQALYAATITVMELFNIPVQNVKGHKEFAATSCPGYDMNQVRKDLADILLEMQYRRSEEYRTASIVDFVARVNHLYGVYQQRGQYWQDAERKLFTMFNLANDWELMRPDQAGKKYPA